MSASWDGKVQLAEADARPGRYYVTCKDSSGRKVAYLLGPFEQHGYGKGGHARALGMVQVARRYVNEHYSDRDTAFASFGTAWVPLYGKAPAGKLNGVIEV